MFSSRTKDQMINLLRNGQTEEMKALLNDLDAMTNLENILRQCMHIKTVLEGAKQKEEQEDNRRRVLLGAKQIARVGKKDNQQLNDDIENLQLELQLSQTLGRKIEFIQKIIDMITHTQEQEKQNKKDCKKKACVGGTVGGFTGGTGLSTTAAIIGSSELGLSVLAAGVIGFGVGALGGAAIGALVSQCCKKGKENNVVDLEDGVQAFTPSRKISSFMGSLGSMLRISHSEKADDSVNMSPITEPDIEQPLLQRDVRPRAYTH